jgi:hypothetical protein
MPSSISTLILTEGVIMKIFSTVVLCASVLCTGTVSAANNNCSPSIQYRGPYANVSAAGYASRSAPIIACTVVRPSDTVNNATAIFSETTTGDAVLEVKYTEGVFPNRIVDDWASSLSYNDVQNLIWQLRTPARATDAAILLSSDPTYYGLAPGTLSGPNANINFGMCAYGYPKDGTAWTSVSISSLGIQNSSFNSQSTYANCYNPPTVFFER